MFFGLSLMRVFTRKEFNPGWCSEDPGSRDGDALAFDAASPRVSRRPYLPRIEFLLDKLYKFTKI